MARHIKILNELEKKKFEYPPFLTSDKKEDIFEFNKWELETIKRYQSDNNKVLFILLYSYFKYKKKFYLPRYFIKDDIAYVSKHLNIKNKINLNKIDRATLIRYKKVISKKLGIKQFNNQTRKLLINEALLLCSSRKQAKIIFIGLLDFMRRNKIEIPTYFSISEVISDALSLFESTLIKNIDKYLNKKDKEFFDQLFEWDDKYLNSNNEMSKIKRYKLTLLKKINQSTKPFKIKGNIKDFKILQLLFNKLRPFLNKLDLSSEVIQYYSQILIKSQIFQIKRRDKNKYLILICFIINQYYCLNDMLIEKLIQTTQANVNSCFKIHKEEHYKDRINKQKIINNLILKVEPILEITNQINNIVQYQGKSLQYKYEQIESIIPNNFTDQYSNINEIILAINKQSKRIFKNEDYYKIVENESLKLQNRVSEIIKELNFDESTSDKKLMNAIKYYKKRDGILKNNSPVSHLNKEEKKIVVEDSGKLRTSLYKSILFQKIAHLIKSGALTLKDSYKYRAFDDYLLPKDIWEEKKEEFIEKTGLNDFVVFEEVEKKLKKELNNQFMITNKNIINGKNKYAKKSNNEKWIVSTPPKEKNISDDLPILFPVNKFISIYEILSTINKYSDFTNSFIHWNIKNNKKKPDNKIFYAGIIGYGCNIGIRKIAKISKNINPNELENTLNWYYSLDNVNNANNKILELVSKIEIIELFKDSINSTHTSSDGQKYIIAVDSLNSNYSFKYFGKGKGVSVYSFIDGSHRLFYSTVISSSEREASYVIDGLLYNDVVESDMHSTDTHGYSEIIFGLTHFIGITFAPRIKNFKDQNLYGFENTSYYKRKGYNIVPIRKINTDIIKKYWDDILRFMVTIKLRRTTASQLLKRLSSYSRYHPLYRAIKEFGKIIKSIFLLKYYDELELRQAIEKQLNKLESSNKLAKAVFYGNNQEFQYATKEEQCIAESCKRLIENTIICWNYLYLAEKIRLAENEDERNKIYQAIKSKSVITWKHINLQGEYDFSDEKLKNTINFNILELLKLAS